MLATLQVPEHDGPVIPATGEPAAIGTSPERTDRPMVRLSHPHALPAVNLPPAQQAVTASTEQQILARTPGHRRDHPRMPRQGAIACPPGRVALPAVDIPHEELPTVPAAATRAQPGAIGAPDHARDSALMSRQPLLQGAISGVPHRHVASIAPA